MDNPLNPFSIVIGLGRSGIGAAKLLHAKGHTVKIIEKLKEYDFPPSMTKELKRVGIEVLFGKDLKLKTFSSWLNQINNVVISPGIAWDHPTLIELRKRKINIQGEVALAWQNMKDLRWVGITGTNGKTTVTYLLQHILQANAIKSVMGGNMGIAATEIALNCLNSNIKLPDWLIMELSSYQIEAAPEISPNIGIWTTLTPDHLERHGSLAKYRKIKRGLLERSNIKIFNADDEDLKRQRETLPKGIWVSTKGEGTPELPIDIWIDQNGNVKEKDISLFNSSIFNLPGNHNLQNLLIVTAAARKIGLNATAIEQAVKTFQGVPHRLELIGEIKGMKIFNDSKATNYQSAAMGVKSMLAPTIVLAGGLTKQGDPSNWIIELQKKACGIVLFGEGADELQILIKKSSFSGDIYCCRDVTKAVSIAVSIGSQKAAKSILFSPACASFDQYKNFEERGEDFKRISKLLMERQENIKPIIL